VTLSALGTSASTWQQEQRAESSQTLQQLKATLPVKCYKLLQEPIRGCTPRGSREPEEGPAGLQQQE
jgi:hypothetical protein